MEELLKLWLGYTTCVPLALWGGGGGGGGGRGEGGRGNTPDTIPHFKLLYPINVECIAWIGTTRSRLLLMASVCISLSSKFPEPVLSFCTQNVHGMYMVTTLNT